MLDTFNSTSWKEYYPQNIFPFSGQHDRHIYFYNFDTGQSLLSSNDALPAFKLISMKGTKYCPVLNRGAVVQGNANLPVFWSKLFKCRIFTIANPISQTKSLERGLVCWAIISYSDDPSNS